MAITVTKDDWKQVVKRIGQVNGSSVSLAKFYHQASTGRGLNVAIGPVRAPITQYMTDTYKQLMTFGEQVNIQLTEDPPPSVGSSYSGSSSRPLPDIKDNGTTTIMDAVKRVMNLTTNAIKTTDDTIAQELKSLSLSPVVPLVTTGDLSFSFDAAGGRDDAVATQKARTETNKIMTTFFPSLDTSDMTLPPSSYDYNKSTLLHSTDKTIEELWQRLGLGLPSAVAPSSLYVKGFAAPLPSSSPALPSPLLIVPSSNRDTIIVRTSSTGDDHYISRAISILNLWTLKPVPIRDDDLTRAEAYQWLLKNDFSNDATGTMNNILRIFASPWARYDRDIIDDTSDDRTKSAQAVYILANALYEATVDVSRVRIISDAAIWQDRAKYYCKMYYYLVKLLQLAVYTTCPFRVLQAIRSMADEYCKKFKSVVLENAPRAIVNATYYLIAIVNRKASDDNDIRYGEVALLAALALQDSKYRKDMFIGAGYPLGEATNSAMFDTWDHDKAITNLYNASVRFASRPKDSVHYAMSYLMFDTTSDVNNIKMPYAQYLV